jgi:GNAT superfamily N-acetyltransferase
MERAGPRKSGVDTSFPRETVPVSKQVNVRVRRVGFRAGTDEELKALHAVEVPIETERGSNRMPQSLESYVAFARNLPSQFSDHTWLVETSDGAPIAVGYCWSNSAGDDRFMECDVLVRRDRRRDGIGSQLMGLICEETAHECRSLLTWSTFDAVPAGEAFSRSLGARAARVNREGELALSDVDWAMVERWASAERPRQRGYSLEMVDGVFPEHLRGDAATFHHIMQTAPRDDLDVGDVIIGADFVAELDRALLESGRSRWTVLVRDPDGTCVGGTEVTFDHGNRNTVFQQNTGIDPEHRGFGLAKWVKAAMLERIRDERPEVRVVRTGNAFSNAPMLAINDALGFKVVSTRTEWQAEVDDRLGSLR